MAQNTYKSNTFKKPEKEKKSKASGSGKTNFSLAFLKDPRFKLASGFFLMIVAVYLFLALFSYLFNGKADFSVMQSFDNSKISESGKEVDNWLGLYGAITSHYFIYRWFGVSAFFIPPLLFVIGFKVVFNRELFRIFSFSIFSVFSGVWLCLLLGYMTMINEGVSEWSFLGGGFGYQLAVLSDAMFGWGTFLILILSLFVFIVFYFNVTSIPFGITDPKPMGNDAFVTDEPVDDGSMPPTYTDEKDIWPIETSEGELVPELDLVIKPPVENAKPKPELKLEVQKQEVKPELPFIIEEPLTIIWESEITKPEYHFYSIQKIGNNSYVFEDVVSPDGTPLSKEAVQKMVDSAKTIIAKEKPDA